MRNRLTKLAVAALGLLSVATAAKAQPVELTLWTHWAAEKPKRAFVDAVIADYEAAHPGVKIKTTWYEKNALYAALKTALRAGQAPDLFYAEPDQVEYIDNGFLLDLSKLNWAGVEGWAKQAWTFGGTPYGLPLEAWTVELFYNKQLMKQVGGVVPDGLQFSPEGFLDLVRKTKAAGITPMALGAGDRPFPGAHLTHEALLKKLGVADYGKLLKGEIAWTDPRVVETLTWVRSLVDAGLLPATFTTMKLSEAHGYFYTKPGTLTFLNGSWYTSRAFNPPDQGGQPADFPLGIMKFPAVPGAVCNECRTIAVGGSYVVNAATKHSAQAIDFLNAFTAPGVGNRWLSSVMVQTGIKSEPSKITDPRAAAFFEMLAKVDVGAKYQFGLPSQILVGRPKEVFAQVINSAFPGGNISVDGAVKAMAAAY